MSTTIGELTSGKSSDFECEGRWLWSVVLGNGTEVWGEYIRTGGEWEQREEVRKQMDVPLQFVRQ
jgi:hypothetical protein